MTDSGHRTGTLVSGDVDLFYRAFGVPGDTPILILHGTNYFDSLDWIGVAGALAGDREVVAIDHRGFGQSGWSPSKDYSLDAFMDDILAVIRHFGWDRPIVLGHSMSGRLSIFFAANFADRLSRLVVVDSGLGRGNPGTYNVSVGNPPLVFDSVQAAMDHFARLSNPPRISHDRDRAERALSKADGGYMLMRDPDYRNTQSQTEGAPMPRLKDLDIWRELAKVRCPTMIVRGLRSDRLTPEIRDRITRDFPAIAWGTVDSLHDIADGAPDELVATVQAFIGAGRKAA
jgi:pimeloyl-ACP methyl ester carboxylesterase